MRVSRTDPKELRPGPARLGVSSGEEYFVGRWLTPARQGMNSIAVGAMRT